MVYRLGAFLAQIQNPGQDAGNIPGSQQLNSVISGLRGWGLLLAGAAIVISAVIWAFGANSQNSQQATAGKRGVLIAIAAAILIGAGPVLINWAFGLGGQVTQ